MAAKSALQTFTTGAANDRFPPKPDTTPYAPSSAQTSNRSSTCAQKRRISGTSAVSRPQAAPIRPIGFVVPRVEACARCSRRGGETRAGFVGMPPDGRNGGLPAEGRGAGYGRFRAHSPPAPCPPARRSSDAFLIRAAHGVQDHGLAGVRGASCAFGQERSADLPPARAARVVATSPAR